MGAASVTVHRVGNHHCNPLYNLAHSPLFELKLINLDLDATMQRATRNDDAKMGRRDDATDANMKRMSAFIP
jgi:hypothetical protein